MYVDFEAAVSYTTNKVWIGGSGKTKRIGIGGDSPISIQTMWKEGITGVLCSRDVLFCLVERIEKLQALGCDILRFAVPVLLSQPLPPPAL